MSTNDEPITAPKSRGRLVGIFLAIAVAGVAGCASPTSADVSTGSPSVLGASSVLDAFAGLDYDYDPLRTPAELGDVADVVVTGQVAEFTTGRELVVTGTNQPSGNSVTLVVNAPQVISGESSGSAIYVELPNPGGKVPGDYNELIPRGTSVLLYLDPAWDGTNPADESLTDAAAGRPDGAALYRPVNPQSFIIQAGGVVVWPLLGEETPGSLSETAPTGSLIAR